MGSNTAEKGGKKAGRETLNSNVGNASKWTDR